MEKTGQKTFYTCVRTQIFDLGQENDVIMIIILFVLGMYSNPSYLCINKRLIDCLGF
jgi:hypothetical protein